MGYILVIDQGTTSSRAIIFDEDGKIVNSAQEEFRQIYPKPSYVEHDPIDILSSVRSVISTALTRARVKYSEILSIGITNQRETVVVWDKITGEPLYNAIVWQCRRTKDRCDELKKEGYEDVIKHKTGLKIDSYFSATKIEWLIENVSSVKEALNEKRLLIGTIDTYLMWQLSGGKIYKTDYTNASRTMLFNINTLKWDKDLCDLFKIPVDILPEVCPSSYNYGLTSGDILGVKIPICGVAGDQQSALFGQSCFEKGDLKVTYGTGCFLLVNSKEEAINSNNGLITTLSCQTKDKPMYALEGSVFVGGAVIQWLRDELKLIDSAKETENLARSVKDTNGVYIVPAFVGMGAPYWHNDAEGLITGITRGTNRAHIVRASLEAICYQVNDLILAMNKDLGYKINNVKVDGGAVVNNFLMEFQANISDVHIIRPENVEVTALGAYYLACLELNIFQSLEEIASKSIVDKTFNSTYSQNYRNKCLEGWNKALRKCFVK